MVKYGRKYRMPYQSSRFSPYRRLSSLYSKLRSRYKPRGGGGSSGGHWAKKPYTLSHNFRYQSEPRYQPKAESKRNSPVIIHKIEPNPYRMPKLENNPEPDAEEFLKKVESRLDDKLIERMKEIIEQIDSDKTSVEDMRKEIESEAVAEKIEPLESLADNEAEAKQELIENRVSKEEFERDLVLTNEAEILSEMPEDEVESSQDIPVEINEPEDSTEIIESFNEMPHKPPEEFTEPVETVEELVEAVLEDPLLAYDLEPELLSDVELLINDLEAEQLEPEAEYIEPGY